MAIIDDHVRATDYRKEAALHSLLRVSPGGPDGPGGPGGPGGHTRVCSHANLAAVGAAYSELQRSWLLDQTLVQLEVATSHSEAYRGGNCVSRSVGCPCSARYEILANLCTHQRSQVHSDLGYSYMILHSCRDLLDFPFLAVFQCRS